MSEPPVVKTKAILVHTGLHRIAEEHSAEFQELSASAGADVVGSFTAVRRSPDPKYFIGRGKVEEIAEAVKVLCAELVLVDQHLSPSQERNLERAVGARVLDRSGLILDIFASRARSFEGKLQVELAQLKHLSTRLVRGWTHLERQKGGIGLRGPGETQLETDRRLIGHRIRTLNGRLEKVMRQRQQQRRARDTAAVPTISLIGYTNAGKSTLFNHLTDAGVYQADQLFATLDPTLRRLDLPKAGHCLIADTVGFVRNLPHELVAAFQATLEETREADLLLHVVDASDEHRSDRVTQVNAVLKEIGAEDVPQLMVMNKIDQLEATEPHVDQSHDPRVVSRIWLSAQTGAGVTPLLESIALFFAKETVRGVLHLGPDQGKMRSRLFDLGAVQKESPRDCGGWDLQLEIPQQFLSKLCREGLDREQLTVNALLG